jgi:hypothetical protein
MIRTVCIAFLFLRMKERILENIACSPFYKSNIQQKFDAMNCKHFMKLYETKLFSFPYEFMPNISDPSTYEDDTMNETEKQAIIQKAMDLAKETTWEEMIRFRILDF